LDLKERKEQGCRENHMMMNFIPSIVIKSRRMKWVGNVASMGEVAKRDVYMLWVEKPGGKRQIGRLRRRLEDNIKMDLKAIGGILLTGFSGSEQGQVAVSCELNNDPADSVTCAESLH